MTSLRLYKITLEKDLNLLYCNIYEYEKGGWPSLEKTTSRLFAPHPLLEAELWQQ